jgi:hypothetical protein
MDVAVVDRKITRPLRAGKVALAAGPGASRATRDVLKTPIVLGASKGRRDHAVPF